MEAGENQAQPPGSDPSASARTFRRRTAGRSSDRSCSSSQDDEVCQARGWSAWSRMLRGSSQFDPYPGITAGRPTAGAYTFPNGLTGYSPPIFSRPEAVAQAVAHEETHATGITGHRRDGTYSGPPGTDPYEVGDRCSVRPA